LKEKGEEGLKKGNREKKGNKNMRFSHEVEAADCLLPDPWTCTDLEMSPKRGKVMLSV